MADISGGVVVERNANDDYQPKKSKININFKLINRETAKPPTQLIRNQKNALLHDPSTRYIKTLCKVFLGAGA
jgi:hypothetical protein